MAIRDFHGRRSGNCSQAQASMIIAWHIATITVPWPDDIDAVPLHNDYLEFLVDGGLVGLGLFTTGLIGCVGLGLKKSMWPSSVAGCPILLPSP